MDTRFREAHKLSFECIVVPVSYTSESGQPGNWNTVTEVGQRSELEIGAWESSAYRQMQGTGQDAIVQWEEK